AEGRHLLIVGRVAANSRACSTALRNGLRLAPKDAAEPWAYRRGQDVQAVVPRVGTDSRKLTVGPREDLKTEIPSGRTDNNYDRASEESRGSRLENPKRGCLPELTAGVVLRT